MMSEEREVLVRAIRYVTEQAANANAIVQEAMDAGLDGSDSLTVHVKQLRAELLAVKGDLERELERVVVDCTVCGRTVHYVGGLGVRADHCAHAEPEPHETPKLTRKRGTGTGAYLVIMPAEVWRSRDSEEQAE